MYNQFGIEHETNMIGERPFAAINNCGFKLTFPNGWTASVMWGVGNYCSNRSPETDYHEPRKYAEYRSDTAEITAWHSDGLRDWKFEDGTEVGSWMTVGQIVSILAEIAAFQDEPA